MKKLICFLLALLLLTVACPLTAAADGDVKTLNHVKYTLVKNEVTVIGCDKAAFKGKAVTIPATVTFHGKAYPVTKIENHYFDEVFEGCRMKSISLPSSVRYINRAAFNDCTRLKSITLPRKLKNAPNLDGCTSLRSIKVEEGNRYFSSRDGVLYNKKGTVLYRYPENRKAKRYIIPKRVKKLQSCAFFCARHLETVTVKAKLKRIPSQAFEGCSSLKKITLPKTLQTIDFSAFSLCTALTSVTIPKNVAVIGNGAFYNCASLKKVYIEAGTALTDVEKLELWGLGYVAEPQNRFFVTPLGTKVYGCDAALEDMIETYNANVEALYGVKNCLTMVYRG